MNHFTNEQQALQQIISYITQEQWDKLKLYFAIINVKYLHYPNNQKILNALKYLYLEKQTTHPWEKIKNKETVLKELTTYLQTHFPQDNFTPISLTFLNHDSDQNDNHHLLENLKHTYTQETLFSQLIKIINPTFDNQDPYNRHLYYQEIFAKLRNFISIIPHPQDKTLLTIEQMINIYPEVFETDNISKQKIQEEYYRLSETFKNLNQATKGFKKGQIITIGGYTGLGKTSFVYNLLLDLSHTTYQEKSKYPHMLVFSFEMTLEENLNRLLAYQSQIPLNVILDKYFNNISALQYTESVQKAKKLFMQINLSFSYDKEKNIAYIIDLLYRLHLETKVEIVVIDHLQITKSSNHFDNDRLAIDEIMTKLKQIAIELNIVIIILSQFSRDTYSNYKGKSPEITALKGSGGIETNSDIVLIMSEFQPNITKDKEKALNIYNSNCNQLYLNAQNNENQKIIEVNIKKNRSGTKKTLIYHFEMKTQTFQEIGYVLPNQIEDF